MNRSFRIVHFTPDPFLQTRFAIGAVVHVDGRGYFLQSPRLPDVDCLGSKASVAHLHTVLGMLRGSDRPGLQTPSPDVTFTPPRMLPDSFGDPIAWLKRALAGETADAATEEGAHAPPRPSPKNLARSFFRANGVADVVHTSFTPGTVEGVLERAGTLQPISQWVAGPTRLLLVEPIVTSRTDEDFEKDLAVANTKFAAYRHELALDTQESKRVDLVALVLGNSTKRREKAANELRKNAHEFVEAALKVPRTRFIATIRSIAKVDLPVKVG